MRCGLTAKTGASCDADAIDVSGQRTTSDEEEYQYVDEESESDEDDASDEE